MMDVWEPWQPKPGDRARVRLSGECCASTFDEMLNGRRVRESESIGHDSWEDGRTGTVQERQHSAQGHYYSLRFDVPHRAGGYLYVAATYAAAELEPTVGAVRR